MFWWQSKDVTLNSLQVQVDFYSFLGCHSLEDWGCWPSDHQRRGIMLHRHDMQTQPLSHANDARYTLNYWMEGRSLTTQIKRNIQALECRDGLWDSEASESHINPNTYCMTELCVGQWRGDRPSVTGPWCLVCPTGAHSDMAFLHTACDTRHPAQLSASMTSTQSRVRVFLFPEGVELNRWMCIQNEDNCWS